MYVNTNFEYIDLFDLFNSQNPQYIVFINFVSLYIVFMQLSTIRQTTHSNPVFIGISSVFSNISNISRYSILLSTIKTALNIYLQIKKYKSYIKLKYLFFIQYNVHSVLFSASQSHNAVPCMLPHLSSVLQACPSRSFLQPS